MNQEGPFIGATVDVVKKPSDTGRWRQWLLKKVVKPTDGMWEYFTLKGQIQERF